MGRLLEFFNHKYPYSDFHELNADWLISAYKELIAEVDALDSWKIEHETEYEELKALYDDIISGNFPESMCVALYNWVVANGVSIFGALAKMVFFGITDDGYFFADVPASWSEIVFNTTGLDITIAGEDYGKLILTY